MLYAFYMNVYVPLMFDDAHASTMERALLSTWIDAHVVICDMIYHFFL